MFSSKIYLQLSFSHYTSRAKIPSSFYKEVVKEKCCKEFVIFVVITWLLVLSSCSCGDTSLVEACNWWSSVLRSLVDLVKSSVDSENPSRR